MALKYSVVNVRRNVSFSDPRTTNGFYLKLHISSINKSFLIEHVILGDNMLNSIWTNNVTLPSFPALQGNAKTDVLIIGAGLAGLLTAYCLEQSGVDYLLIEADTICRGISRNTTAKITSQHGLIYHKLVRSFDADYARMYWQAHESALAQLRQLCDSIPCDFEAKDSYIYSIDQPQQLEQEAAALSRANIPFDHVQTPTLPFATAGAIKFSHQAQFHPLKFAAKIAENLNIREHTTAREIGKNCVLTNHGRISAKHIIVTTHFPILNKHGSYFLKMYQDRSYVLALEHAPDLDGMYLDAAQGGLSLRNYGSFLLLGGGSHHTGKPSDGWKSLESAAQIYYPNAKKRFCWAAQDCMTLDRAAYIGQYSKNTPHLYVATGFNKWGMTSSMLAAMILCDMIQGKENPYSPIFSPSRTILRPRLLSNGLEAVKNLLAFSTPRCPHLGCALKWNPHEHSWDCPCHGSRFTKDGTLLDNPATRNLRGKP